MPKHTESRAILVCISDIHVGSKLGLCPPEATIDLGGGYTPNPWQKWSWEVWNKAWDWVDEYIATAEKESKNIYKHFALVGDAVDIDIHGRSGQIWARSQYIVKNCTCEILEPIAKKFDTVQFIKGTEAHNGLNNDTEDMIAEDFDNNIPDPETGEPAWWSSDIELGGVKFNLSHHGRMGQKPWTKKNPIESLRGEIIMHRFGAYEDFPDVVVRGHFHQFQHTDPKQRLCVVQLPGWQLKTAFVNRVDPADTRSQVGLVLFDCQGGSFKMYGKAYTQPRGETWKPPTTESKSPKKLFQVLRLGN